MSTPRFRQREYTYRHGGVIGEFCVLNETNGLRGNVVPVLDATSVGTIHEYARCWDAVHPGPPYLEGGQFYVSKLRKPLDLLGAGTCRSKPLTTGIPASVKRKPGDVCRRVYEGLFSLGGVTHGFGSLGTSLEALSAPEIYNEANPDDLSDLGNRAYVRLRPKIEGSSLLQTLAEYRSVPRMLKTSSKGFHDLWTQGVGHTSGGAMSPKKAADQFLNFQFGWKPFIQDVQSALRTLDNFEAYERRVSEFNGRWMKRSFSEDLVQSEEVLVQHQNNTNACSPSLSPSEFLVPGSCFQTVTRQKYERVWYKGVFKYYRPEFDYRVKQHAAARRLRQYLTALGLRVSPTTVYKVMPWTWLVDWGVNVSDYVQRVEDMASDAMVSKSFYLMREYRVRLEYRKVFQTYDGTLHDLKWYREVTTKRRGSANSPFHFSTATSLTTSQLAILAALGLTAT